ncbi:thermonuclease family protein [Ferrovibrio sp.]|uniref:thermonuclease family protein n=1 Tax=Ferrovibrio sp. TaxID=1917215 RepID=UPI0025B92A80|nr:thermonuclease family protein [Ferrovibrio sp.]
MEQARVIDGDTMEVVALIWLDQRVTTRVRLEGIDTPEKRSKCIAEREAAEAATKLASDWLERNKPVVLRDLSHDKYGRRVVGRVQSADGRSDLGETLIAQGLARRYDGGTKRPWCP